MLWAAYGWTPADTAELTPVQLAYALEHMPLVEARRHFPMARLHADVREFIMPRYIGPDPDAKEPEKPPRPREPWSPLELLPWYASFGDAPSMTPEHAESLAAVYDRLPEWARSVAPIEDARRLLETPQA